MSVSWHCRGVTSDFMDLLKAFKSFQWAFQGFQSYFKRFQVTSKRFQWRIPLPHSNGISRGFRVFQGPFNAFDGFSGTFQEHSPAF